MRMLKHCRLEYWCRKSRGWEVKCYQCAKVHFDNKVLQRTQLAARHDTRLKTTAPTRATNMEKTRSISVTCWLVDQSRNLIENGLKYSRSTAYKHWQIVIMIHFRNQGLNENIRIKQKYVGERLNRQDISIPCTHARFKSDACDESRRTKYSHRREDRMFKLSKRELTQEGVAVIAHHTPQVFQ